MNGPWEPRGRFCSAGPIFGRPKMGEKDAGETPDPPLFLQSVGGIICGPVATEHLPGLWPLVTGGAVISLRLTALGLKDFTVFSDGTREVFHRSRQFSRKETRFAYPFKRATAEESASNPVQISSLEDSFIRWQCTGPVLSRPIGQKRGTGVSPARFCLLFPRRKSRPPEAKRQRKATEKFRGGSLPPRTPRGLGGPQTPPAGQGEMLLAMSAFPPWCGKPSR